MFKEEVEVDPPPPKGPKGKKGRSNLAGAGGGQRGRPSSSSSNSGGGAVTSSVPSTIRASPSSVVQSSPAAPVATMTGSGHLPLGTPPPTPVLGSTATTTVPTPGSGTLTHGTHNSLPQQVGGHFASTVSCVCTGIQGRCVCVWGGGLCLLNEACFSFSPIVRSLFETKFG
jgi:Predicted solute binding protein